MNDSGQRLVDALVRRLDLEVMGDDRFRGLPGRGEGRVFGGMLLAQGLVAAGRTVEGAAPHSLHAHFLRPARHGAPLRVAILGDPGARRPDGPLEVRECDPEAAVPAVGRPARRALWIRLRGVLPDDPLVHAAVLAFTSDRGLLSTAARPHGLMWGARQGASLDHALWLHGGVRFDDWVLYASESPVAVGGRGLVLGAMYARSGARLASVAQEGLIRRP